MIDARGVQGVINARKIQYFSRNILDFSIVREKGAVLLSSLARKMGSEYGSNIAKRRKALYEFGEREFALSSPNDTWESLEETARNYDIVIVGSDQLWLPSNIAGDYYTLSFVPDSVIKASYATSFGVSKLPASLQNKASAFLSRIRYLSVRELSGRDIVRSVADVDAKLVCDPTLLLASEEWKSYASARLCPNEDYILCYFMGDNPNQREMVRALSEDMGWKIVTLPHLDRYIASDKNFGDYRLYDVSPFEFLGLFSRASCVCTDSFHGTIFSIQFHRPLFVFPRFSSNATLSTNTRIESLLKVLDFGDCFVKRDQRLSALIDCFADYDRVDKRILDFRAFSVDFLKEIENDL